jgi:anti-sigma factor RsiW
MRCEEVQQQLRGFSTGELPMDVRQTVQAHLSECAACCAELAKVDALAGFLTGAQAPPVPSGFASRVLSKARQRQEANPAAWNLMRWWRVTSAPMHAAAAAVLVIGLGTGALISWNTWQAPAAPPAQAASQTDPLASYNVDYLTDAPDGSLAQTYLALVSTPAQEGK